jgi:uncharacterized protein (UPF0548 family)
MWFFRRPTSEQIRAFREQQSSSGYSYPHVGASEGQAPASYDLDHNRVQLGTGQAVFAAGCEALRRWRQFPAPWTEIHPNDTPLVVDNVVAVLARVFGIWWLNACRIVYVVDEHQPVRRFGFAYGTLSDHVEQGEERFTIEQHADESVWYDIRAFSRPRHPLVRLSYPLSRILQRRFARDSKTTMQRLCLERR